MNPRLGVTLLFLSLGTLSCDAGNSPVSRVPASLLIVSGKDQVGIVGTELAQPLVVRVVNDEGDPVPGQLVNFRVTEGGGSVFAGSALTNQQGIAQERWTLGTQAGSTQAVEARAVDPNTGEPLVFGIFQATAVAGVASGIQIQQGSSLAMIALGDSAMLSVAATDAHGNAIDTASVVWSATNSSVVEVSASGNARAKGVGSASVIATTGTAADTIQVQVEQRPAFIEIGAVTDTLHAIGDTLTLTAVARDRNGNVIPGQPVTWHTSDVHVTVDAQGRVVARQNGTAQVLVSPTAQVADTVSVVVQQVAVALDVRPDVDTLYLDGGYQFTAHLVDSNDVALPGTVSATWSSGNAGVAQVDTAGRVTPAAVGASHIVAQYGALRDSSAITTSRLKLVYGRSTGLASGISTINPDGTGGRSLASGNASNPDWSPDGERIVFGGDTTESNRHEIWVMNADGSNKTRLTFTATGGPWMSSPAWSPDGRYIAFNADNDIWRMTATGDSLSRLTFSGGDSNAEWSPDGSRIAFWSRRDQTSGGMDVWVMDADGSNARRLTFDGARTPSWYPDGSAVLFDSNGFFRINPDGTNRAAVVTQSGAFPVLAPHGRTISYTSNGHTRLVEVDGSNDRQLVLFGVAARWRPQ